MKKNILIAIAAILLALIVAGIFSVQSAAKNKTPDPAPIQQSIQTVFAQAPQPKGMDAEELFDFADQERSGALEWNQCMADKAMNRAEYIVANDYLEHTDLDGKLAYRDLIDECFNWMESGENLAAYYETSEEAHAALMASPTHKANIMSIKFHQMGVGCFQGVCVELFAN